MNTLEYVLHEPPHDMQPDDPVRVVSAELERMKANKEEDDDNLTSSSWITRRLVLLGRCIDWLDKSIHQGTVPDSQEARDALEAWLCEECKLQTGEEACDEYEVEPATAEREPSLERPSRRW